MTAPLNTELDITFNFLELQEKMSSNDFYLDGENLIGYI